jgi:hypothetical protein
MHHVYKCLYICDVSVVYNIFISNFFLFMVLFFYTSEDLKWSVLSNRYWNLTLAELKCPILILQGFKRWRQQPRP